MEVCTGLEAPPELCLEKKAEQQRAVLLTQIAEKELRLYGRDAALAWTGGGGGAARAVRSRGM